MNSRDHNGDEGEKMPLMTQIMKKCESEAQQKIAEAKKQNKDTIRQYDSENDGGEVLHDPKAIKKEEEAEIDIKKEIEENGFLEDTSEISIDPEEILNRKKDIKELYTSVLKLNKALERVKKYPELMEEVEELRKENKRLKNNGRVGATRDKRVGSILPR